MSRTTQLTVILLLLGGTSILPAAELDYNRDIRPILGAKCFECHGPDEGTREAGLRLDVRAEAVRDRDGMQAIAPGNPKTSKLIERIFAADPDDRMPPPESKKSLTESQKATLRQWIGEGAAYSEHWGFVPPVRPAAPDVRQEAWPRNPIDYFVLGRLEEEGLQPSPEADRYTLVRRLYLDLIGLPPTPEQADAFVNDPDPGAYELLVDRLLASPRYGERWARRWLDLARYSDTNGYEKDRNRSIWPYRDWVIDALNEDMPFDRFTIEQLAGDMLPDPTPAQRIATGFHRNTMLNEEGGIDPLEFRFHAVVDRVNTTGAVWLGMTIGCAQCHTHKYDPVTQTEYYELMACLNNADEPRMKVPVPDVLARRAEITQRIAEIEAGMEERFPVAPPDICNPGADENASIPERRESHIEARFSQWLRGQREGAVDWLVLPPDETRTTLPRLTVLEDGSVLAGGDQTKRDAYGLEFNRELRGITALRLEVLPHESLPGGGPGLAYYEGPKGDFFLSELTLKADGSAVAFKEASHTYAKLGIGSGEVAAELAVDGEGGTGWSVHGEEGQRNVAVFVFEEPIRSLSKLEVEMLFERHYPAALGRFRISVASDERIVQASRIPHEIERLLLKPEGRLDPAEREKLRDHFLSVAPELEPVRKEIAALRKQLPELPTTLVMSERPADHPRPTFRHHRGEFLQPKERVQPGVPDLFGAAKEPRDRLEFARWLVNGENPLTARVVMNRHWEAFFGRGIVRTAEDFGTQASPPSHPKLLDWLATEFVRQGWSFKSMHRLIVMSATYRQSEQTTPELLERDSENVLLARGPRFRLEAELVRDAALTAAGLISPKMGGPSVFPPQPASVTDIAYGNFKWKPSEGGDRYRRSLYTFSKRTAPFAAYSLFDAPSGEECLVKRSRSNTPLQALALLNDQVFVESSRALAGLALDRADDTPERRARFILRRCITRPPSASEVKDFVAFYENQKARVKAGELDPKAIAGDSANAETAAWTMAARAALNLDETISR